MTDVVFAAQYYYKMVTEVPFGQIKIGEKCSF